MEKQKFSIYDGILELFFVLLVSGLHSLWCPKIKELTERGHCGIPLIPKCLALCDVLRTSQNEDIMVASLCVFFDTKMSCALVCPENLTE